MKPKLAFLLALTLLSLLLLPSCGKKEDAVTYKIVTPTYEEICELDERLSPILGMYRKDYDFETADIYSMLFSPFHLSYVSPEYDDEVTEYISEPLCYLYGKHRMWSTVVYENDPKGNFEKIPDAIRDENGNVSEDLIWQTDGLFVIGHNKFLGDYIDWLVEGVWNGKVNHTEMYIPKYNANYYYLDGFYYTPEYMAGGGGPVFEPEVESITPLENGKYEVRYKIFYDVGELMHTGTAVVAMKESSDGFRFWSIFSIDIE